MRSTTTTIRSWPALLLAAFFAIVTGRVLLDDVIAGAPFTVVHLSSIAALVAAIGALHYALPALRAGAIVAGVILGVSGLSALGYVVVASGMRNAETTGNKEAAAEHVNAQRAGVLKMLGEAEYMLAPCPKGAAKGDFGERCGLREAMAKECASGKGKRCDGKAYSVRTYEAAIDGYTAQLAKLGPERKPFAGYQRSADFLAGLPFVTASADAIRADLERLMPYAPVVVVELVGLGFALFAFGHRKRARPDGPPADKAGQSAADLRVYANPKSPDRPVATAQCHGRTVRKPLPGPSDGPRPGSGGQSVTREEAEADLLTLLALGQSVPSQRALAERWGRPKQTVSDWLRHWEADGLIPSRRQIGREKMLAATHLTRSTVKA